MNSSTDLISFVDLSLIISGRNFLVLPNALLIEFFENTLLLDDVNVPDKDKHKR